MADSVKIRIEGDDAPFQQTLSGLSKVTGGAIKGISAGVGALSAAWSAAGLTAIKAGSDFTASMSEVQAISGASAEELALLEQTAKDYGATTSFSASQAADGLKYMALAGWDAQKSVDALPGVLNLAAASGMELGAASDMVTDYLSAFGMEADKATYFSDMLAHAQSTSNTTAAALGEAYRNCAANLNAAGQDVETVTAALMGMANQGLKGSAAGTAIAAIMRDIGNKMEDGAIKIGKTSVAVQDAQGNYRDLTDIMLDVQAATDGMGTAQRTAALSNTFTADSIRGVNMILQEGTENIASYEEGLRGASGAAEDMANTMLDNLQGDVTMFKSALEGLQISAFEGMESPARSAVQMATEIVNGMNDAYKRGGVDGLVSNISAQIPKLMTVGVQAASKMFSGIAKSLPGLVKNLFSALPSVLGSIVDLVPQISDSLFTLASSAVETLIGQLPQLVPKLIEGIGGLFVSAAKGAGSLIGSVFSGIWTAMGDLGLRDLTLEESIQQQIDGLDMDKVHDLGTGLVTYSFDTEVDPGNYQAEIDTAVQTIHDALLNIPGLDESQRAAIEEAILKGSGADALEAALDALEVPDAAGVAEQITTAMTTISNALSSTGLSEEAKQKVADVAAAGGDVQGALEELGVDPATAEDVASKITGATTQISSACAGLDIDTSTLVSNATTDKGQIEAALKLLGLQDSDIDSILGNLDTVSGKLSAVYTDLFDDIGEALTNGIPDDSDPDLAEAKAKLEEYIQAAHDKLVEWRDAKLAELQESGLTGEALATETANIQQTFSELSGNLDSIGEQANQFIEENAGKATSTVQANLGQLQQIADQASTLNAQIDGMVSGALSSGQNLNRKAVEQGLVGDERGQLEAINYTSQELQNALDKANQEAAAALEQAETKFAGDAEGYAARRKEIMDQLGEKEGAAYDTYSQHMSRIVSGMLQNNPELEQALAQYQPENEINSNAAKLYESLTTAMDEAFEAVQNGGSYDMNQFWNNLDLGEADVDAIANALGFTPDGFRAAIEQMLAGGLKGEDLADTLFGGSLKSFGDTLGQGLTEAFAAGEIDFGQLNTIMAAALEQGLLPEDVNLDNLAQYIIDLVGDLKFKEGHVITPPLTVEPQPEAAPDTQEKIEDTVEEAASETGEPATAEPEIVVDPSVTPTEGTSEQIAEEVEKSTQESGKTTTVEPEIDVEPDVKPAEGTQEKVAEAAGEAAGEQAPPVEMTMDVNASVGNITFTEGGGIAEKLTTLFSEQSVPVTVNVNASIGEVTTGEGAGIQEAVAANLHAQPVSVNVNASANVNISVGSTNASAIGQGAGQEVSAGIASGINSGSGQVQSSARNVVNSGATAARGAVGQARSAGLSFSNGLAAGIRSGQSSITAAARAVAAAAAAAARSALAIHSPSKVTRKLGESFSTGLAQGINDHEPLVSESAARIANSAVSSLNGIIGPGNFTPRFSAESLSGTLSDAAQDFAAYESERPVKLYVNGREMGRVMDADNSTAINALNRRVAVGYGK